MKSFVNKLPPIKYIDAYFYYKEILKPKLIKIDNYVEIIEKIKNDEYFNKFYTFSSENVYGGEKLIRNFKIKFVFFPDAFSIKIYTFFNMKYITFKQK